MSKADAHRYLFETSFDPEDLRRQRDEQLRALRERTEAEARATAPAPPPPTYTEDDLTLVRARAYAEGEAAGAAATRALAEQRLAQALAQLPTQLAWLIEDQRRANAALTEQAVEVCMTIARRLMPELERRHGLAEVEAVIRDTLREMVEEPRLVVRVADGLLDTLSARLGPLVETAGYAGSVVLLGLPGAGPSDCRVEWADGGVERVSDRIWEAIDAAVARMLEYPAATLPDSAPPAAVVKFPPSSTPRTADGTSALDVSG